jgi:hypothetical protein
MLYVVLKVYLFNEKYKNVSVVIWAHNLLNFLLCCIYIWPFETRKINVSQ